MVGNPHRWRVAVSQLENRNSTAGCLLAILFFVPLLAKVAHFSSTTIMFFVIVHVSVIVPLATGIISTKYIFTCFRTLWTALLDEQRWSYFSAQCRYAYSWLHYIYLRVDGVQKLTTQLVFFVAAEKLFCPSQTLASLYVLLLYSFFAYLFNSLQKRPWTRISGHATAGELIRSCASFTVARLGKATAACLAFFSFAHRFRNLDFPWTFLALTFFYFLLSQSFDGRQGKKAGSEWLSVLELQVLDGLEEFWTPVFVHSVAVAAPAFLFFGLILRAPQHYALLLILGYINFCIPFKYYLEPAWEALNKQMSIMSKFPLVSWNNSQILSKNSCAICLEDLHVFSARITPCGHVFHGSCLRKCFSHSKYCPLCKTLL